MKRVKPVKVKPLSAEELEEFNAAQARRGIVLLGRVPPGLFPGRVKQLLSGFGCAVTRVYLEAESAERRARRARESESGSRARRFERGWVEFADRAVARRVAASLNGTAIGYAHSREPYAQDLWVMRYEPRMHWADITAQAEQARETRVQRIKMALARAKRENELFLTRVAQSNSSKRHKAKAKTKTVAKKKVASSPPTTTKPESEDEAPPAKKARPGQDDDD
jgi:ESF2/ABP1 family protein